MVKILESLQMQEERLTNIENLLTTSKNVLNINEVSILTGLSKSSIYKFTHTGRIPFYKQAKHLYFNRQEIEAWLTSHPGYNADETQQASSTYVTLNKGGRR